MIIGIDFDNTVVNYDAVFFRKALDLGLIEDQATQGKKGVRDQIRLLPDGELRWQELQSYVYTQGMAQAQLINGVKDFFVACRNANITTYIVSHKTLYANALTPPINLREIALDWMKNNGFFNQAALGLNLDQIYFEETRLEKIARIKTLGCTHFIDDLEEVFLEDQFPSAVKKILYSPDLDPSSQENITVAQSWKNIHEYFFN